MTLLVMAILGICGGVYALDADSKLQTSGKKEVVRELFGGSAPASAASIPSGEGWLGTPLLDDPNENVHGVPLTSIQANETAPAHGGSPTPGTSGGGPVSSGKSSATTVPTSKSPASGAPATSSAPKPTATSAPVTTAPVSYRFAEYFGGYSTGDWSSGKGSWRMITNEGRMGVVNDGGNVFEQSTTPMNSPDNWNHSLIATNASYTNVTLTARAKLVAQVRTSAAPYSWEADWLMWGYSDPTKAYKFSCNPAGWQVARLDPTIDSAAVIFGEGTNYRCAIGTWHTYKVVQNGGSHSVYVNGTLLKNFSDPRPLTSGSVALRALGSHVRWDDVTVQ